jgi:hypothetical protein
MVLNFPGFNSDHVQLPTAEDQVKSLSVILGKDYPFVPVELGDKTVVIDHVTLASRIAQLAVERV